MKKLFTFFSAMLFAAGVFAATEQTWYNDVKSISNNGQYYIYSVNGAGFMQAGQSQVKSITTSNYTNASTFKFTIANPEEGTVKSGNYYLKCYKEVSGTSSGPLVTSTGNGTNIIFTSMSNGSYWNIHGHYNVFGERYPALYYKDGKYDGYLSGSGLNWSTTKDVQTAAEYRWYVVSQAQLDRHFAIYFFDVYKESLNITQYSGLVPAAYYTALENAYNQTFSVQNADHSADAVNTAKTALEGLYNGAAAIAEAYATAKGAINTLAAVEDKGEDFAEVTTDINNANSALEQATTVEAINAAVANLKAIDPITFTTTTFTALQSIGTPAASAAARTLTFSAVDATIINAAGMALKAGTTTLTATAAATAQYYKFVRSAQVTVNKAQTLVVPVDLSFCLGGSVTYRGTEYTAAGEYNVQATGAVRDTTYQVTVTVLQPTASEENKTIAYGAAETWHGYNLSGYTVGQHDLTYTTTNIAGCDSVVTLHLTVTKQDVVTDTVKLEFCEGDSVEYRGVWYTEAGESEVYAEGQVSDTLYVIEVTVNESEYDEDTNDKYVGEVVLFDEAGWYLRDETPVEAYTVTKADTADLWFVHYSTTEKGCESVFKLSINVELLEAVELEQELFFCPGESVEYRDKVYSEVGKDTLLVEGEIRDTLVYVYVTTLIIDGNVIYATVAAGDAIDFPEGEWYLGETPVSGTYVTSEADVPELKFTQDVEVEGCTIVAEYIVTVTSREGIESVFAGKNAEKFFRNGVLYIRRGEAVYTATGERVE